MAASKMSCNCGHCSSTSTAACRRSSTAASRMSCSSGHCSSSSTAACQVMGVIDLLFFRNGRIPEEEEEDDVHLSSINVAMPSQNTAARVYICPGSVVVNCNIYRLFAFQLLSGYEYKLFEGNSQQTVIKQMSTCCFVSESCDQWRLSSIPGKLVSYGSGCHWALPCQRRCVVWVL